jgi:hypothetical protein
MTASPFPLSPKLPPGCVRTLRYWQDLRRGESAMPFSDDIALSALPDLADWLFLVDVFATPQRFRWNHVGQAIVERAGAQPGGKFLDDGITRSPFNFTLAQASATVEAREPTFYAYDGKSGEDGMYARIMLPCWGNGRIDLILGMTEMPA